MIRLRNDRSVIADSSVSKAKLSPMNRSRTFMKTQMPAASIMSSSVNPIAASCGSSDSFDAAYTQTKSDSSAAFIFNGIEKNIFRPTPRSLPEQVVGNCSRATSTIISKVFGIARREQNPFSQPVRPFYYSYLLSSTIYHAEAFCWTAVKELRHLADAV